MESKFRVKFSFNNGQYLTYTINAENISKAEDIAIQKHLNQYGQECLINTEITPLGDN